MKKEINIEEEAKRNFILKMIVSAKENLTKMDMQNGFFARKQIQEGGDKLLQKLGQIQAIIKEEQSWLEYLQEKLDEK